jgi:DNA-binding NtrC family response regulator
LKYFTLIGNHDAIGPDTVGFGAALTIFMNYIEEIDGAYILTTPDKPNFNYKNTAEKTLRRMQLEKKDLPVTIVEMDLDNPVNFDLVYKVMLDEVQKVMEKDNIQNDEKIINITSGTPTMTTCWVLLQKSGLIPNAKLIQSFETKYQREHGKSCQEVDLDIDDFPEIKSPNGIKVKLNRAKSELKILKEEKSIKKIDESIPNLIGNTVPIREIKQQITKLINTDTHVLILGEPGTGKEVIAKAIWNQHRTEIDKELNVFDSGTFSEELILSELFGHVKGAFTGAGREKSGIVEKCNGKMLFLDEIGNIPRDKQNVLMRFLQFGEWRKVGSDRVNKSDIQIIAATNKDINDSDIFAPDLRDRFDETIKLPSLKTRKMDIKILTDHFLFKSGDNVSFDEDVYTALESYSWPGNIRQLEKWINRICRYYKNTHIQWEDIPDNIKPDLPSPFDDQVQYPEYPINYYEYTNNLRKRALEFAGGNQARAAELLSIKPTTMRQWVLKQKKQ